MNCASFTINAPCKGCADRKVGCHDECPKYKAFQVENEKRRENERRVARVTEYGYSERLINRRK